MRKWLALALCLVFVLWWAMATPQRKGAREDAMASVVPAGHGIASSATPGLEAGRLSITPPRPESVVATCEFFVTNEQGEPLEGVRVAPDMAEFGASLTGADGTTRIVWPEMDEACLTVAFDLDGYCSTKKVLDVEDPTCRVVLVRPSAVRGVVRDREGNPPAPGCLVLAWPQEMGKSPEPAPFLPIVLDGVLDPTPEGIRVAVAGSDGSFRLEGISSRVPYFCLAGGKGAISDVKAIVRGMEEIELDTRRVYGARLEYRTAEGTPFQLSPTLTRSKHMRFWSDEAGIIGASIGGLGALLAGASPGLRAEGSQADIALFFSEREGERVGPCHYFLELPGYEPVELEFFATPLELGMLEVVLTLQNQAPVRGRVRVSFTGVQGEILRLQRSLARGNPGARVMVLHLEEPSTARLFRLGFDADLDRPVVLEDVPAGSYLARVVSWDQLVVHPEKGAAGQSLVVEGGVEAEFVVDLSEFGAIRVVLVDGEQPRSEAMARLSLCAGEPQWKDGGGYSLPGIATRTFHRPPFGFALVRSGQYTLKLTEPAATGAGSHPELASCTVQAGLISRSRFAIDARGLPGAR